MNYKVGEANIKGTTQEYILNDALVNDDINMFLLFCIKHDKNKPFEKEYMSGVGCGVVYFLLKSNEVIYIGATETVSRVAQHRKEKDFDTIVFMPCKQSIHFALERALIKHFKPPLNKHLAVSKRKTSSNTIKQLLAWIQ